MQKIKLKIVIILASAIALLNAWLFFMQPNMLFYPHTELIASPKEWGLKYEDVTITTPDQLQLHGWFIPVSDSKPATNSSPVILFFHGNAGNISHRGDSLRIFNRLGLNVLIVDYRGYGKSTGSMSEQGAYIDAKAAWQYLTSQRGYKPNNIIIFGRSLGGAVASQLATQVPARGLILESTFSSVRDMANQMMPLFSKLVYLRYRFDTAAIIKQVKIPLLLMHSQSDEVVPYELGEKVFAAANSPKFFYELQGGHNGGFMNNIAGYAQTINWFIDNN